MKTTFCKNAENSLKSDVLRNSDYEKPANCEYGVGQNLESQAVQKLESQLGKNLKNPLRNTTKKCENEKRVSRKDEKLRNTEAVQKRANLVLKYISKILQNRLVGLCKVCASNQSPGVT